MIHRIEIYLPLPRKVGVFSFNRKKKVGFSFDNMAKFLFGEYNELNSDKDLKEWIKINGQNVFFVEQIYAAHKSYCLHEKKNPVDKTKFMLSIASISKDDTNKLMECWKKSQNFGSKKVPGKKKKR